jgi:superfamily II DNA or RNA helicase
MELRDYQTRTVENLRLCWRERPLVVAPCGAGKTTIAAEIIRKAVDRGRTCGFLVHRVELLDQAVARLADLGIQAGAIVAGRKQETSSVHVASIQTLQRRELPDWKVVIVDEAHHAVSPSWERIVSHYVKAGAAVIGLTATPFRLDGKGLGKVFGKIVVSVTPEELIARGLLVEPVIYAPPPPDLTGVRTVGGDYEQGELALRMLRPGIVGKLVEHWMELAPGRRTVGYGVNREHAQYCEAVFREHGVATGYVDGETPKAERAATLARLRSGEITMVWNVQVLTEGWDLPSLECAIVARPTKSLALWTQMQGRVLRACDNKTGAIILDHAGNTLRLGLVTDAVDYSLEDKVKRRSKGAPPVCPKCYAVVAETDLVCPQCGFAVAAETADDEDARGKPEVRHVDGRLVEFKRADQMEKRTRYEELVATAHARGARLGWARHQYKIQFGAWPRGLRHVEEKLYRCDEHEPEDVTYGSRTATRCRRCLAELRDEPKGELPEDWLQ